MNEHLPSAAPHPPYDELRSSAGTDADGHAAIDDLHRVMHDPSAPPAHITGAAERARSVPVLEATIANWWDSPRTQNWLKILSDAGL
jgi:hypothetical protein